MRDWIVKNWARIAFIELGLILCFESVTFVQSRPLRWIVFLTGVAVVVLSKRLQKEVSR